MADTYLVARSKKSGKLFEFVEINEDGFGYYREAYCGVLDIISDTESTFSKKYLNKTAFYEFKDHTVNDVEFVEYVISFRNTNNTFIHPDTVIATAIYNGIEIKITNRTPTRKGYVTAYITINSSNIYEEFEKSKLSDYKEIM